MKAPLVIVLAAMTYAASPDASYGGPTTRPESFIETNSDPQTDLSKSGSQVTDERDQPEAHHRQTHDESGPSQAHGDTDTHQTDQGADTEHQDTEHVEHAEHHAHKEAFLFRLREAYLRKKGELRVGFDFGYIRGKERLKVFEIEGFSKKKTEKERIRFGDFEYILKIDYGITDRLQVTAIIPYFSIREHVSGEPYFGNSHLGDSKVELWYAFTEEDENTPAISGAFQLTLPTGDYKKGIGNDRVGYGAALAITKDFGGWVLYGDFGYSLTPGAKIRWSDRLDSPHHDLHGFSYGVGALYKLPGTWRATVEFAGKTAQEIELNDADWSTQLAVIPGLRRGVSLGSLGVLEYGVAFPIGLTDDSEDWGVLVKLDWSIPAH